LFKNEYFRILTAEELSNKELIVQYPSEKQKTASGTQQPVTTYEYLKDSLKNDVSL
jgi:hypothetical protein